LVPPALTAFERIDILGATCERSGWLLSLSVFRESTGDVNVREFIAVVNVHGIVLLGARHGFNELLKTGNSHINVMLLLSAHVDA